MMFQLTPFYQIKETVDFWVQIPSTGWRKERAAQVGDSINQLVPYCMNPPLAPIMTPSPLGDGGMELVLL
jgi:hypothetical protein